MRRQGKGYGLFVLNNEKRDNKDSEAGRQVRGKKQKLQEANGLALSSSKAATLGQETHWH